MVSDDGWLARFVQFFGPLLAAWSAFLAFLVHLKKIRNAEKAASHNRLLDEIDRLRSERDVKTEEIDMVRDKLAERDAENAELMKENARITGYNDGIGEARQEAQRIVSVEREADAQRRRGPGNGGGGKRAVDGDEA